MGAIYDQQFYDGTRTGPQIRSEFQTLQYQGFAECEQAARKAVEEDDDLTMDDFDEIHGDILCYAGNYATLDYLELSRKKFKTLEDADNFMHTDESPLEKWYTACAAKVMLDEKQRKEYGGVKADKNGYVWCIFALLAC